MARFEHFPLVDRLHTDVLEDKYGPITSKVIRHTKTIREAHLTDSKGVSRTYAITFFPKTKQSKEIDQIDKIISKGTPIGKAFRDFGYAIRKNVIDVFVIKIPVWLQREFHTKEEYAKARLSEFYAKQRTSSPSIYGTVVEVYSPDFRGPIVNNADLAQTNASTSILEKAEFSKDDIWQRLGRDNGWSDVQERYFDCKKKALPYVFSLKKKIRDYIKKQL